MACLLVLEAARKNGQDFKPGHHPDALIQAAMEAWNVGAKKRRGQVQVLAILLDGRQRLVNADCWVQGRDLVLQRSYRTRNRTFPGFSTRRGTSDRSGLYRSSGGLLMDGGRP